MTLINTDALVLRTYNLAEADRIVLCLTRSSGLIRAVAKGARRMKSRFGAAFEPFTLVRIAFHEKENRELVTISNAEILRSNFSVASQPEVAEVLGVADTTVKTHLGRVYEKTGAGRQADLVKLVAGFSSPLSG